MSRGFDDAVVGAGVLGLAHAYHLARRGRRVVVFERHGRAEGASVRNFGMLWPIGQPAGDLRDLALRSLELWRAVLRDADLWHEAAGSLHLAYRDDEQRVLAEFAARSAADGFPCEVLTPAETLKKSPAVRRGGLRSALWSPTETCVDPREVIAALPGHLAGVYGVRFEFGRPVTGFAGGRVATPTGAESADRLWVCAGDEFGLLYPETCRAAGLSRCKLQMLRTAPFGDRWRLGPMLAAGLTLRHYRAFAECPSLPALKARVAAETPEYDRYGVHVMASQNGRGEVVLGDSHEYGEFGPFDSEAIDALILDYLATFLDAPGLRIASRWHGTYARHPTDPYHVARPAPGVVAVTAVGGAGMTLAFGLAERVTRETLGD